jgi:circadian clock protein KaiB
VSARAQYRLRLYVAGSTRNSAQAIANLAVICGRHLVGRHKLEIVDVIREPMRAFDDGVLMTPMLLKLAPGPLRKIVGTLSQTETVMEVLGIEGGAA